MHRVGCDAAQMQLQAPVHGSRRLQRHLLFENDANERRETWTPAPQRRLADATKDPGQIGISRREYPGPASKRPAAQNTRQVAHLRRLGVRGPGSAGQTVGPWPIRMLRL